MKKIYCICIGMMTCAAIAQPSLSHNVILRPQGSAYMLSVLSADDFETGAEGEDVYWSFDLSGIATLNIAILDPSQTQDGPNYPSANRCKAINNTGFFFFNTNVAQHELLGFVNPNFIYQYLDTKNVELPLIYGDTITDSWIKQYATQTSVIEEVAISKTVLDAYGTMELNGELINDVMRVHTITESEETTSVNGEVQSIANRIQHNYTWYSSGIIGELLEYNHIATEMDADLIITEAANVNVSMETDLQDFSSLNIPILLYPNPSIESIEFNQPMHAKMEVYKCTGELCRTMTMCGAKKWHHDLESGAYMLRIMMQSGEVFTERLMVGQ